MKKILLLAALLFLLALGSKAQRFELGLRSGMNFTKPQGEFNSGKWEVQNGPVAGLFANYHLTPNLFVQTGLDYTTLHYRHITRYYYYPGPWYVLSSYIPGPVYPYIRGEGTSYNFYRVPLTVQFKTNTKLSFHGGFGGYFALLDHYSKEPEQIYYGGWETFDIAPVNIEQEQRTNDYGLLFETGLTYPIAEKFSLGLSGRYFSGKQFFDKNSNSTHRGGEVLAQLTYTPGGKLLSKTYAGDTAGTRLTIGYKQGLLFSDPKIEATLGDFSPKMGYAGGLYFEWKLTNGISLQPELLFERKGLKIQSERNQGTVDQPGIAKADYDLFMDYATIPVYLNIHFGNKPRVYLYGGPFVSMMLQSKVTGRVEYSSSSDAYYSESISQVYDNIDGPLKDDDWGLAFGAGFKYPIAPKLSLDLSGRYARSFDNVMNEDLFYPLGKFEVTHRTYLISAGIEYNF